MSWVVFSSCVIGEHLLTSMHLSPQTGVSTVRATHGQQIIRSVQVPIHVRATGIAYIGPARQGQFPLGMSTPATPFRGGVEAWRDHQRRAVPAGFILQLPPKLVKPHIRYPAGQFPILEHPRHIQVLDHDPAVVLGQVRGQLVKRVLPNMMDPEMETRQAHPGLGPVP